LRLAGNALLQEHLALLYAGMEYEKALRLVTIKTKMTTRGAKMIALDRFQAGLAQEARVLFLMLVLQHVGMALWSLLKLAMTGQTTVRGA